MLIQSVKVIKLRKLIYVIHHICRHHSWVMAAPARKLCELYKWFAFFEGVLKKEMKYFYRIVYVFMLECGVVAWRYINQLWILYILRLNLSNFLFTQWLNVICHKNIANQFSPKKKKQTLFSLIGFRFAIAIRFWADIMVVSLVTVTNPLSAHAIFRTKKKGDEEERKKMTRWNEWAKKRSTHTLPITSIFNELRILKAWSNINMHTASVLSINEAK